LKLQFGQDLSSYSEPGNEQAEGSGEHLQETPILGAVGVIGYNYGWLVVWNMAFIFHNARDNPCQLTFIFFRGVGIPPTRW